MTESNQKRDLKFERQLKNGGVEKQRSAGTGCSGIGQKGSSPSNRVQIAFTTDTKAKTNLMSYVFVQCHVLVLLGAFAAGSFMLFSLGPGHTFSRNKLKLD